jgi:hypothetical protein
MNKAQRTVLTRLVAGYTLSFFVLRFFQWVTPSRLQGPPLFTTGLDLTYWAYRLLHLQQYLMVNRVGAMVFDLLVLIVGLLVLLFPLQRKWIIVFSILITLYAISFNSVAMIHTVTVDGLILVFLPFWFRDGSRFGLAWEGIRYYACFLYFSAFIWKAFIGDSFSYWGQGVGTFKLNLLDYLYYHPDAWLSGFYRWFLRHEWALNSGHVFIILLEASMGIGFFSRKFDRVLFWIPLLICIITYFFADVFIFELLVLNFAFLSREQLAFIGRKFKLSLPNRTPMGDNLS